MNQIRSFRNADLPALTELWVQHWATVGPPPDVTVAKIEQAILARTFFDRDSLLLAESSRGVEAWCHFGIDPARTDTTVIVAICLAPESGTAGQELLEASLERIAKGTTEKVEIGLIRDDRFGYAGLSPVGHGIGIPESATGLTHLISDAGFSPLTSATRMVVSTEQYRPPVSREALQLRRSTALVRETAIPEDIRHASAMSHLDVERHRLVNRGGETIAEIDLWCSDPEAEVMNSHHAILDISQQDNQPAFDPTQAFLVASMLQMLASRHIFRVETAIDSDEKPLWDRLQSLRFEPEQRGFVWAKS